MPLKHSHDLNNPGGGKPSKPPGGSASRFTLGSSRMRSDLDQVEEEDDKKEHDVFNEKEVDKKPPQLAPAVYLEEGPNKKDCHDDDPPPSATENVNKEEDKKPLQLAPAVYLEEEPNNQDCHDDDSPPSATDNVNKEENKKRLQLAPAVYLEEETNNENCHDNGTPSANDTENAAATTDRRRRGLRPHSSSGGLTGSTESIDYPPGAFPIRGMGRSGTGALSIDEEATILYSMGAPNGFTNDGAVGASDNDDFIMYPQEENGNAAPVSDLEQITTSIPIAAELAQDMEQELAQRLQQELGERLDEERRQQPVVQAIEMKQRICGVPRGCFAVVVLGFSVILGLVVFFATRDRRVEETLEPTPTTIRPTDIPADPITVPPTESRFISLVNLIGHIVTKEVSIFQNTSSHEYTAMEWLANNDTWAQDIDSRPVQSWVERYALVFFYFFTNGQIWAADSHFLNPMISVCNWHTGIECEGLFVVRIDFHGEGITGRLPTEIFMPNLELLFLYYNQFTGSLPSEIGLMVSLTDLDLYGNNLTGPLPSDFGHMVSLTYLNFARNDLTGPLPSDIGHMVSLEYVDLEDNDLTGPLPSDIGLMVSLTSLDLSTNDLTGTIPSEIGQIGCNIEEGPFCHISLGGNSLSGTLPTELGFLIGLDSFSVSTNQLTGPIPSEMGRLTNMGSLDLSYNQFAGTVPIELSYFKYLRLEIAHFEGNNLTGSLNDIFCDGDSINNANLPELYLLESDCLGETPEVNCSCCVFCCRDDDRLDTGSDCAMPSNDDPGPPFTRGIPK